MLIFLFILEIIHYLRKVFETTKKNRELLHS